LIPGGAQLWPGVRRSPMEVNTAQAQSTDAPEEDELQKQRVVLEHPRPERRTADRGRHGRPNQQPEEFARRPL
jgi:hypothetical protein